MNKNMDIKNNIKISLKILIIPFLSLSTFYGYSLKSQTLELPEIVSGEVLESIKGSTVNTQKSTGTTSSLTFGSSTRFGTSASVNATSATKSSSESIFKVGNSPTNECPSGGCINSNIGDINGNITAKVSSIKANNLENFNDTLVNSSANKYTNANAEITGVGANNSITLDGNETIFKARAATVHSNADFDSISSQVLSSDAQTSSASSSGFTSTNTNVDINVSDYVTTFQQAF
tara:strand:- start:1533 stop:2234 length:702 start_codon:yes stop_codon:yes gene_type:complete